MRKNNCAARAARFLVQMFDVVCQTTTWNFHIGGADDNAGSQQYIFHSLPLHENHSYQASESVVRLFCTTRSTWNNRKRLNLTQSSILLWRFRCSCRRSFLNSLICCRDGDTADISIPTLALRPRKTFHFLFSDEELTLQTYVKAPSWQKLFRWALS